ncbi:hypothetical protein H2201_009096 [Coniosporium apollinis]|uniref:Uncharacterized protein n=1 Tax=Coniosporium apollinis TaxID=61459 RepID=A0ABQ9NL42_9PEZI|nr:hypothetical protein H2201_009096 [Coniosporium apollinis]
MEGDTNRYVTNAWLDVTGWDEHLKGFDREQLIELVRPAVREEPEPQQQPQDLEEREGEERLADACKATRRLIKRAIQTCRHSIVGKKALDHVNGREVGEQTNEWPFYARQKVKTIRKYSDHWVKVLRMQLWKELLLDVEEIGSTRPGTTQLPKLKLDRLSDNPSKMMEGWSFLQDTRNTFDVDGKRWLFKRALAEERLKKEFIRREQDVAGSGRDIPWRGQGVRDYMQQIRRFKERLFVLVHMTSGSPARGREVVSVQYKNRVNGRGT